ncbi:glycosyltransferase [Myroides odoratimimus]|uniref:glycosyltransferase family 2 protein n=1 Tax=Myroides odoratimimus TaxID=76832 RepID=UPI002097EBF2|nr:glycosyltransferase family 2 protein [Myroides odoratimimus]MCO7723819.1 glycosyltransferase [Myroides odoratimimus]
MNKVSVIVPVYNVERYLSKCIESVLRQQDVLIELILINDGSTDGSYVICEKYAECDTRIKIFNQNNRGVSAARNVGIKNATGDWICFVDADDWLEADCLKNVYTRNHDVDMIIARSYVNRNSIAREEKYPAQDKFYDNIFKGTDLFIDYSYLRGSVWGVLYKRDLLLSNKITFPLDLRNGEDSIFYTLCIIHARSITFANVFFYNIYEREGSASRSWTFDRVLGMVDNVDYINNYIAENSGLDNIAVNILNYSKYGVISNVLNHFSYIFSLRNYFKLRRKIRCVLVDKIDIGKIRTAKYKTRVLNFSLDLFAVTIFIKNKFNRESASSSLNK